MKPEDHWCSILAFPGPTTCALQPGAAKPFWRTIGTKHCTLKVALCIDMVTERFEENESKAEHLPWPVQGSESYLVGFPEETLFPTSIIE